MIQFHSIALNNFMTFESTILSYSSGGLILVEGDNRDHVYADSNLSGKTNLMVEALLWCLCEQGLKEKGPDGNTSTQYRKDDVVRHGEDYCEVMVEFSKDGKHYCIWRTKKRNGVSDLSIRVDGNTIRGKSKADTQEKVDSILGMSYETASQVLMFGQGTRRFTQAKDSERKKIFEEILSLGIYGDALKVIREKKKEHADIHISINKKLVAAETIQEEADIRVEEAKLDYKDEIKKHKSWKKDVSGKKQKVLELVKDTRGAIAQRKDEIKTSEENIEKMESRARGKLNEIKLEKKRDAIDKKLKPLELKHEALELRLETIEDYHVAECPTCKQILDKGHMKRVVKETRVEMYGISDEINSLIAKRTPVSRDLMERGSLMIELDRSRDRLKLFKELLKTNRGVLKEQLKRVAGFDDVIPSDSKPDDARIKLVKKKYKEANLKVRQIRGELKILQDSMDDIKFWEVGFGNKGIKSLILDSILPVLNLEANRYIHHLMDDVEIEFDTETTTKSGETRDTFEIRIRSGESQGYHMASGGERRRIDFCISLALQSLLASTGSKSNIFILDEPFESVDESGIGELIDLLREYSRKQGVAVYCITHLSNLKPLFDDVVTVQRQNGISTIV